ncbi:hypothetical protein GIS00_22210 [Nakamurella sp. YIM 132087]|uniref:Uncharacterized protein n=1 Tax=Nakamurella alba TaxID=2665158 RepID=A0A7K1FUZ7_9ACTN|nr:hypothetical protein [Nakamurella alba]MTD16654.1 hypothetical protein [Nakamurella alba]
MFDMLATPEGADGAVRTRAQVLDELRRRMTAVGPGREKVGPALRAEPDLQPDPRSGSGQVPEPPALAAVPDRDRGILAVAEVPAVGAGVDQGAGKVFAVPGALAGVLPRGGLPRGGVVSLSGGRGTTSLLLSLLAAPPGAWSALVGMPGIGLQAAAEFGVDLDRIALVPDPGPDVLQVLSVLADGVDLLAVAPPERGFGGAARLRVLTGRLRQRGAVLLVAGPWPGADLVLRTGIGRWEGVGTGHGRLRGRTMRVEVGGRGAAGPGRSVEVLLTGDRRGVRMLPSSGAPLVSEVPVEDLAVGALS